MRFDQKITGCASFQSSLATEALLILTALIAVYIVLGMLYESLIHPLTILSTLPSAGLGALLAILVTGDELSIVSIIGIIGFVRAGSGASSVRQRLDERSKL